MIQTTADVASLGKQISIHKSGRPWAMYAFGISMLIVSILIALDPLVAKGIPALTENWWVLLLMFLSALSGVWVLWNARRIRQSRHRIIVYEHGLRWLTPLDFITLPWNEVTLAHGELQKKPSGFDAIPLGESGCLAMVIVAILTAIQWLLNPARWQPDRSFEGGSPEDALGLLETRRWLVTRYIFYSGEQPLFEFETQYYGRTDGKHFVSLLREASHERFALLYSTCSVSDFLHHQQVT